MSGSIDRNEQSTIFFNRRLIEGFEVVSAIVKIRSNKRIQAHFGRRVLKWLDGSSVKEKYCKAHLETRKKYNFKSKSSIKGPYDRERERYIFLVARRLAGSPVAFGVLRTRKVYIFSGSPVAFVVLRTRKVYIFSGSPARQSHSVF